MKQQTDGRSCLSSIFRETTLEKYTADLLTCHDERASSPFVISMVGGGGKTTTLLELFFASENRQTVLTTTTAMIAPAECPQELSLASGGRPVPKALLSLFVGPPPKSSGVWYADPVNGIHGKYSGVGRDIFDEHIRSLRTLRAEASSFPNGPVPLFLCEADGSKRKPLKAHAPHEPVIPETTDLTLITFGLSGLGKPLSEDVVHRSALFAEKAGLEPGGIISFTHLLTLLERGVFLKGVPPTSRVAVIFNQMDTLPPELRVEKTVRSLAKQVLSKPRIDAVFFRGTDHKSERHITEFGLEREVSQSPLFSAVLLAAGTSTRMRGKNKLLLPLSGEPIVVRTLRRVLTGNCREIIIVTGHQSGAVREAIQPVLEKEIPSGTRVIVKKNPDFEKGQGTSVASGTKCLSEDSFACSFVPADQPFVSPAVMRALAEKSSKDRILIPCRRDGSRTSPVLFGRAFYDELSSLTGNIGGTQVIQLHPEAVQFLSMAGSDLQHLDVDTPETYRKISKT